MAYHATARGASVASSPSGNQEWEALRKEARKLEGELESKVAAFAKLCTGFDASLLHHHHTAGSGAGQLVDQLVKSKSAEIDSLLKRLSNVNDRMGSAVSSGDVHSHTLARHRDILQEFSKEARRLNASVGAARDRAELLAGSNEATPLLSVQVQGALLRERNTVASSTAALDDVVITAQAVSSDLKAQRDLCEDIQDKLHTTGARFPVVNGLLRAISRRKSRDTVILSTIIAACILVLLIYFWRR